VRASCPLYYILPALLYIARFIIYCPLYYILPALLYIARFIIKGARCSHYSIFLLREQDAPTTVYFY